MMGALGHAPAVSMAPTGFGAAPARFPPLPRVPGSVPHGFSAAARGLLDPLIGGRVGGAAGPSGTGPSGEDLADEPLLQSPILLSLRHYAEYRRGGAGAGAEADPAIVAMYNAYRTRHANLHARAFFERFGSQPWFKERYSLVERERDAKAIGGKAGARAEEYWAALKGCVGDLFFFFFFVLFFFNSIQRDDPRVDRQ
jgi:hypothetical protein